LPVGAFDASFEVSVPDETTFASVLALIGYWCLPLMLTNSTLPDIFIPILLMWAFLLTEFVSNDTTYCRYYDENGCEENHGPFAYKFSLLYFYNLLLNVFIEDEFVVYYVYF